MNIETTTRIIQLAREAGFYFTSEDDPTSPIGWYSGGYDPKFSIFIKFADLILKEYTIDNV